MLPDDGSQAWSQGPRCTSPWSGWVCQTWSRPTLAVLLSLIIGRVLKIIYEILILLLIYFENINSAHNLFSFHLNSRVFVSTWKEEKILKIKWSSDKRQHVTSPLTSGVSVVSPCLTSPPSCCSCSSCYSCCCRQLRSHTEVAHLAAGQVAPIPSIYNISRHAPGVSNRSVHQQQASLAWKLQAVDNCAKKAQL